MPGDSDQQVTIKTEIGSTFKRLPSFRTPRDLKLSEYSDIRPNILNENRTKKVFIPNLNVQRRKQTDVEKEASSPAANDANKTNQKERSKREESRGRGRGRGKRQTNFIQGTGIFSEGLAPTLKTWNSSSKTSEASTSIPKPKLNLKDNKKVNKEEEEQVIKELLRDDFIEDPDIQPDLHNCPISLPMQDCKSFIAKCEMQDVFPKQEVFDGSLNGIKVKKEPDTFEEATISTDEPETKPVSLNHMLPLTIPELLAKSSDKSFLFFQVPSCLPNMKVPAMETLNVNNSQKEGQKMEDESSEKCVLRTFPSGRIGKLQILKSGRARLLLGDVKLWVEPGTQTAFKQDLISINLDANQKTGNMINLGDLTTRMVITPDWESLLLKQTSG